MHSQICVIISSLRLVFLCLVVGYGSSPCVLVGHKMEEEERAATPPPPRHASRRNGRVCGGRPFKKVRRERKLRGSGVLVAPVEGKRVASGGGNLLAASDQHMPTLLFSCPLVPRHVHRRMPRFHTHTHSHTFGEPLAGVRGLGPSSCLSVCVCMCRRAGDAVDGKDDVPQPPVWPSHPCRHPFLFVLFRSRADNVIRRRKRRAISLVIVALTTPTPQPPPPALPSSLLKVPLPCPRSTTITATLCVALTISPSLPCFGERPCGCIERESDMSRCSGGEEGGGVWSSVAEGC